MSGLTDGDCEALAAALQPFAVSANIKGALRVAGVVSAVEAIVQRQIAAALSEAAEDFDAMCDCFALRYPEHSHDCAVKPATLAARLRARTT